MVSRAVSRRYAKGLLQAAVAEPVDDTGLRALAEQLRGLADIIAEHRMLRVMLVNPAVAPTKKAAIVLEVVERLGLAAIGQRFIRVLGEKDRLSELMAIAEVFGEMVDERTGVINAEITTPTELGADSTSILRGKLAEATGRSVRMTTRTDPEIMGGLITRIGDLVYDGSVRQHLDRIHEQIVKD